MPKPRKKGRLWELDPATFQPGPKAGLLERVLRPVRSLGKYLLFALAFAYPLYLVVLGVAFGGLVFWSAFAGSIAMIGIVITKAGYSKNFRNWDVSIKKMGGLVIAFLVTLAFYFGLIYLRLLVIPVFVAVLVLGLFFSIRKGKI